MGKKIDCIFRLQGVVQGVGFRPFVYRIAIKNNILGYVRNNAQGVLIYAQGTQKELNAFRKDLQNPPNAAKITSITTEILQNTQKFQNFLIEKSTQDSKLTATIPADIALCKECLRELRDTKNRRFNYPFISCTNCGGRYSLIHTLPYDRNNTAMAQFIMCKECQSEYENPNSRRFHSEINCCEKCGPRLFFVEDLSTFKSKALMKDSMVCTTLHQNCLKNPLNRAIESLKQGKILAIKGVGGYTLVCNGLDSKVICRLRKRKRRPSKPFAIMCKDMDMVESYAKLSPKDREILNAQSAPIVLVESKNSNLPLREIAPNLSTLGVILPYAPLHYLLLEQLDFPLIFTSANLSGEPIAKEFREIMQNLNDVCDGVLLYNREILNPIDDSLVRTILHNGKEQMQILRRARGFLCDINLPFQSKQDFLALGAQQKATFCLKTQDKILLSPHLGDLENVASVENFLKTQTLFAAQYQTTPQTFVLDLHPHYTQRQLVQKGASIYTLQHHFAHLLSNLAENAINKPVLGVIFDGTGYGENGKIWGGEFLSWNPKKPLEFQRVAYFDDFVLLGGEKAIKEIKRLGLALLFATFMQQFHTLKTPLLQAFSKEDLEVFSLMFSNPKVLCNSVGRLFDGVSALCGVCLQTTYEGEGGMLLESLAKQAKLPSAYPFIQTQGKISYQEMIKEIYRDLQNGVSKSQIALNFHFTLANIIAEIAKDYTHIALSGGCFQNALLTQLTLEKLKDKIVYLNKEIPCNDGGISIGQAYFMDLCLTHS